MQAILKITRLLALPAVLAVAVAFRPVAPPAAGFVLQGTVAAPDGTKVYLSRTGPAETKDSTVVKANHFTFKGRVTEPVWSSIQVPKAKRFAAFFIENHPMTVTLPADEKADAVVTGSVSNQEFQLYNEQWKAITQKAGPIYEMLNKATPPGAKQADSTTQRVANRRFAELGEESKRLAETYIKAHPNTVGAASVIQWRFVDFPDFEEASKLYKELGPVAKASYMGKSVDKFINVWGKTAEGSTPEFAQADPTGKLVKLSDYRGKYVLVDFWASWCGPCRAENPNVKAMYSQYHAKGFDVLGVSLDSKKDLWLKAVETDGLAWTQVSDLKGWKNEVATEFGIRAVPQNFLVDPQGKVVAKNLRGKELQAKLAQLFAAK